jgi:hypothetical protein
MVEKGLKRANISRYYIIGVTILFSVLVIVSSALWHLDKDPLDQGDKHYYEWIWFAMVGFGALSVFALLAHTMYMEKPRDFARLPVYEFFALSILVVSLILGVVFFPTYIFPPDMGIQKTIIESTSEPSITQWVISIGGANEKESVLQIPIYVLVAGNIGAYLRYLYRWVKKESKVDIESIRILQHYYLVHKKVVNTLCIAAGLKYEKIAKSENTVVVKLKHLHKTIDSNRKFVYFLPPGSTAALASYLAKVFDELYYIEDKYESAKLTLRSATYERTIVTICFFFLAPILAIVAWLLLLLSGTDRWEAFAVAAFSAGLASNSIIKRIWTFIGENFGEEGKDEPKTPAQPSGTAGQPGDTAGSG